MKIGFPKEIAWLINHPLIGIIIAVIIVFLIVYGNEIINLITKGRFEKPYDGGRRK